MRIALTLDYEGDLADSLRAVASLVEEYGEAFLADPTSYFSMHNDGSVSRVNISNPTDNSCRIDMVDEIVALVGGGDDNDVEYFEECPLCHHRELSDGYGANYCPECSLVSSITH